MQESQEYCHNQIISCDIDIFAMISFHGICDATIKRMKNREKKSSSSYDLHKNISFESLMKYV